VSADTRKYSIEQKLNAFLARNIGTVVNMTKKCTDSDIQNLSKIDYIMLRINDSFKELPKHTEELLLHWADELYERSQRHGVLVHCYGGENRSCLLAGLILLKTGITGKEAVSKIMSIRPTALYNEVFKDYLGSYHG
jgi:protein-tyrosine phosphatase